MSEKRFQDMMFVETAKLRIENKKLKEENEQLQEKIQLANDFLVGNGLQKQFRDFQRNRKKGD